jgi:hypothetical protein
MSTTPLQLFHVTTEKLVQRYHATGCILPPVRGFNSLEAAMFWAMRVGRKVILRFDVAQAHRLPDHHNAFGSAYWSEAPVPVYAYTCVVSPKRARP